MEVGDCRRRPWHEVVTAILASLDDNGGLPIGNGSLCHTKLLLPLYACCFFSPFCSGFGSDSEIFTNGAGMAAAVVGIFPDGGWPIFLVA